MFHQGSSGTMDRLIDSAVMMLFMATLTPVVTAMTTSITKLLTNYIPKIINWLRCKFGPKWHYIRIKIEKIQNEAGVWKTKPEYMYNNFLINALLEYTKSNGIYPADVDCNLSEVTSNDDRSNIVAKSREFEIVPGDDINVGDFVISYSKNNREATKENKNEKSMEVVTVSSKLPVIKIEEFLRSCYDKYVDRHWPLIETEQIVYLYKQTMSKDGIRFKKYELNSSVTFDNLYMPEKEKIIELADKFQSGELSKLSFLLHGKPGLGKTSIIKALANYLKFTVIEVKLSFLSSDAQLMDLFHNRALIYNKNNDEQYPLLDDKVPLNKRIYVLEDIDAECDEILQRKKHDVVDDIDIESEKKITKAEDIKNQFYERIMKKYMSDGITLAGILNALDGVLELRGVLVMTSNFPKKLDSALTRPGRITMNIKLRKMLAEDANRMIKDKFGETIDEIEDHMITPATLESYCQAAMNIHELRKMLINHNQ